MTESDKQSPELETFNDDEDGDTEGHRVAFQGDQSGSSADERDAQDDDTQGHMKRV